MITPSETGNPWAEMYQPFPTLDEIAARVAVTPKPLEGLSGRPTGVAAKDLEKQLKHLFVPSNEDREVLAKLYAIATSHAASTYVDRRHFLARCQKLGPYAPDAGQVTCFTGPAGAGKSDLIRAFRRLLPAGQEVLVSSEHDPYPVKPCLHFELKAARGNQIMSIASDALHGRDGSSAGASDGELFLAKALFRFGTSIIIPDEFQHLTHSVNANALLTKTLLAFSYLGPPLVFVCNYSLVWKLLKRNQEDQQRLLVDPLFLGTAMPDESYVATLLQAMFAVAPDQFDLDPELAAAHITTRTLGNRRAIRVLITLAFEIAHQQRERVDIINLRAAYASERFASFRNDAMSTVAQWTNAGSKSKREDLNCPFGLPTNLAMEATAAMTEDRERTVAARLFRASLPIAERAAFDRAYAGVVPKNGTSKVVPLNAPKHATVANLLKNAKAFREPGQHDHD